MTTTANIELGLKMIQQHNFAWFMCDYGYNKAEASAKADMRDFVRFLATCTKEEAIILREKWIAKYNEVHEAISKSFGF